MYKVLQSFSSYLVIDDNYRLLCTTIYLLVGSVCFEWLTVKYQDLFILDTPIEELHKIRKLSPGYHLTFYTLNVF